MVNFFVYLWCMETKQTWYYVVGTVKTGFKIQTNPPRGKYRREPLETKELAQRYIAGIFCGYNN